MCSNDHQLPVFTSFCKGEFGVRVMQHASEIGMSADQLREIVSLSVEWKYRYVKAAEEIVSLGNAIDRELCEHDVDTDAVQTLAARRRDVIGQLEDEYVETWAHGNRVMSADQFDMILRIYHDEFKRLPHPIIGTDAFELRPDFADA
jgi:hypothetical protein